MRYPVKPVIVKMATGEEKEFVSQSEAARETGVSPSKVSACCRGDIEQVKGLVFRFKGETDGAKQS